MYKVGDVVKHNCVTISNLYPEKLYLKKIREPVNEIYGNIWEVTNTQGRDIGYIHESWFTGKWNERKSHLPGWW